MIMEHCEDLLPSISVSFAALSIPRICLLNISREMLQHDRQLKIISNNLDKKLRAELTRLLTEERRSTRPSGLPLAARSRRRRRRLRREQGNAAGPAALLGRRRG